MDDYEYDLENAANDIISQIKNQGKSLKKIEKEEYPELTKEEVDEFILKQASTVIRDSAAVINALKEDLLSGGTPNDAMAFAEVLKSFTSAVEVLNKRQIANDKNKTQKEIKTMDIESKQDGIQEETTTRLMLSQNEIITQMLKLATTNNLKDVTKDKPSNDKIIDV